MATINSGFQKVRDIPGFCRRLRHLCFLVFECSERDGVVSRIVLRARTVSALHDLLCFSISPALLISLVRFHLLILSLRVFVFECAIFFYVSMTCCALLLLPHMRFLSHLHLLIWSFSL